MATAKQTKRTGAKKKAPVARAVSVVTNNKRPVSTPPEREPNARRCPLVLDGEMDAEDFTPDACLTCDEFDCPFCEAAHGSGALRSRLFDTGEATEDANDDAWGDDEDTAAFGGDEDEGEASDEDLV